MGEYQRQRFLNRVLASSDSRYSTRLVLSALCWSSDFKRPVVTITKNQMVASEGISRRTAQRALKALKAEGTIKTIWNEKGGRGRATSYELMIKSGFVADPEGIGERPSPDLTDAEARGMVAIPSVPTKESKRGKMGSSVKSQFKGRPMFTDLAEIHALRDTPKEEALTMFAAYQQASGAIRAAAFWEAWEGAQSSNDNKLNEETENGKKEQGE